MAKATIIEKEKEVVVKTKEKTGVTLELTVREANLLHMLMGKTLMYNGDEPYHIYDALRQVCQSYDAYKNHGPIDANYSLLKDYIDTPLK